MNYATAKALRDAGFPQISETVDTVNATYRCVESLDENCYCPRCVDEDSDDWAVDPTLPELIAACGETRDEATFCLRSYTTEWTAGYWMHDDWWKHENGPTPEEAVAALYLALHPAAGSTSLAKPE